MTKITFDTGEQTPTEAPMIAPVITDAAAARVAYLLGKDDVTAVALRIAILGGGCNGYSYSFKLVEQTGEKDEVLTHPDYPNVQICVDPASYRLLSGSEINFVETLEASQFVIQNPNAKSSCGCGSSFSV